MNEKINCNNCVSTKQMRESVHCTKTIIKQDSSFIPECFVRIKNISQEERNYLMCPTYNLGIYSACQTCPLPCPKNPNQKKSPIQDIINLIGSVFGINDAQKNGIASAFEKLNNPDFKEVYSSLERSSNAIKDIMNGKLGSSDVARKVLESETSNLKYSFENLVKDGKITDNEANAIKNSINSTENIQKLKFAIDTMKKQQNIK